MSLEFSSEPIGLQTLDYTKLVQQKDKQTHQALIKALHTNGIVALSNIPGYVERKAKFLRTFREFSSLEHSIKLKYQPDRTKEDYLGFELGAEKFKDRSGQWVNEDKKASYYAWTNDDPGNRWPEEIDLRTPYQDLGRMVTQIIKEVLDLLGINKSLGIDLEKANGFARALHYQKEGQKTNFNPLWCGEHFDHSTMTALIPSVCYLGDEQVPAPQESGLFVKPYADQKFSKVKAAQDCLLLQVGEFGQIITDDKIRATNHLVKKSLGGIERYTFAVFLQVDMNTKVKTNSVLKEDSRAKDHLDDEGYLTFKDWNKASFDRYLDESTLQ